MIVGCFVLIFGGTRIICFAEWTSQTDRLDQQQSKMMHTTPFDGYAGHSTLHQAAPYPPHWLLSGYHDEIAPADADANRGAPLPSINSGPLDREDATPAVEWAAARMGDSDAGNVARGAQWAWEAAAGPGEEDPFRADFLPGGGGT